MTIGGIALAVLVVLAGCDWLLGPRVDSVSPEDLADFSASQTIASDEASVQGAVFEVVAGAEGSGGAGCAIATIFQSEEFQSQLQDAFPGTYTSVAQFMSALVDAQIAQARSISVDGDLDDDDTDDKVSAEITILIENETVNGVDADSLNGQGTATIARFFLDAAGSVEITGRDAYGYVESGVIEGSFDHDASISYDEFSCDGVVIIHDGQFNSNGSGRSRVTVDGDDIAVFWRFGYAMSAGFSFSNTSTLEGGKLIIDFSYSGREDIEFNVVNDSPDEINSQISGEVDVELVVKLYDNANNLVVEYTFDNEDIYGGGSSLTI